MATLHPIATDPATAVAFVRKALESPGLHDEEVAPFRAAVEREIAAGSVSGALRMEAGRPVGVAVWETSGELGATVQVLYLAPGWQTRAEYRAFLEEIRASTGPLVFAPGFLSGLPEVEEARALESLGFARFSRSEMRLDLRALPRPAVSAVATRVASMEDLPRLARLHERAYRDQFDRYLFLVFADPAKDAELATREILTGRWGEFLSWASPIVEADGEIRAAALVVRAPYGPLIADVMVDPSAWGQRLGRTVVATSIESLRGRGESVAVLNVTEGNERALRLYRRLGFVRSLGPSRGWYSKERIPRGPAGG
jgi:ribosomal protein S18 acetylase RimI-like enzyme